MPGAWLLPSPSHHHLSLGQCHSHLPVSCCYPCHLWSILHTSACSRPSPRKSQSWQGPYDSPLPLTACPLFISSPTAQQPEVSYLSHPVHSPGSRAGLQLFPYLQCTFHRFPQDCTLMPSKPLISDCNLHLSASTWDHLYPLTLLYFFYSSCLSFFFKEIIS